MENTPYAYLLVVPLHGIEDVPIASNYLEKPGDLGVSVRDVSGLPLDVTKGTDDIAQCQQATVDVDRL